MKFKKGDYAYITMSYKKVQIIKIISSSYYHVRVVDESTGFGVSSHRLMSEEEYTTLIHSKGLNQPRKYLRPPADH